MKCIYTDLYGIVNNDSRITNSIHNIFQLNSIVVLYFGNSGIVVSEGIY